MFISVCGHVFLCVLIGFVCINAYLCNYKNYKSQILPAHKNLKILLRDWKQKRGRRRRRGANQVCTNGGGNENSNIRLTFAVVTETAVCQSWMIVWICLHELVALELCTCTDMLSVTLNG